MVRVLLMKLMGYARLSLDAFGFMLVISAFLSVLYYWDPTRTYFKRFRMDDPYRYEEIDHRLQVQDPADLVNVRSGASAKVIRENLTRVIWGSKDLRNGLLPDVIVRNILDQTDLNADCENLGDPKTRRKLRCELDIYRGWKNLESLDELHVSFSSEYSATIAYFRPLNPNGTLVLYHHGYAGTFHDQHRILERLVAEGYTVAAFNLVGYGDNSCTRDSAWCDVSWGKFKIQLPMRLHFSPPVATINYAQKHGGISTVAMIGFSAGAWVTTVLSSVEPRIARSYSVAGIVPVYVRRGNEWPKGQRYAPLVNAATVLDLFILSASPAGRKQWQIYNRYDRCCYNGIRSRLYGNIVAEAVRNIDGGQFVVLIDETHARHKISRWAFQLILRDLEKLNTAETSSAG